MSGVVVLDSGPLGLLTNPHATPGPMAAKTWLSRLVRAGRRVILPEIVDYETRRELLRAKLMRSVRLLDMLPLQIEYLPINTAVMRHAAVLWADIRNAGLPTASPDALDGDVILAAQALSLGVPAVVATVNIFHLSRFVPAQRWQDIAP